MCRTGAVQEVRMRGAMLFAAGLFVGVAVHVGLAQRARTAW
jgi:hypothetical protein